MTNGDIGALIGAQFPYPKHCCAHESGDGSSETLPVDEDVVMNQQTGIHICGIYVDDIEEESFSQALVAGAAKHDHMMVYIYHHNSLEKLRQWISATGVDVDDMIARGQLRLEYAPEIYMQNAGNFGADLMLERLSSLMDDAVASGYKALRITGEMSWSVGVRTELSELCRYESLVNKFMETSPIPFIAICQYNRNWCPPRFLNKVLTVHPVLLDAHELFENFYYVAPREYLNKDRETVLNARIQNLKDRKRLLSELESRQREALGLKERAEAAAKAKADFLASMSHEIRTPMCGIITASELLKEEVTTSQQQELVLSVCSSSRYLLRILNDVLLFSQSDAEKLKLESVSLDIGQTIIEAVNMFDNSAKDKNVSLKVEGPQRSAPNVMGDPTRLQQIVANLVSNALKFTPRGGEVCVSFEHLWGDGTSPEGAQGGDRECSLRVCVQDTGIGISLDKHGAIFEAFAQAEASTTRQFGGSGLGLAICTRLVTLMHGSIRVVPEKTAVGRGTCIEFTVRLPLVTPDASSRECGIADNRQASYSQDHLVGYVESCAGEQLVPETCAADPDSEASKAAAPLSPRNDEWRREQIAGLRILLVEDNKLNQRIMAKLLKALGCSSVELAENGQIAVSKAASSKFDVILMDIHMPVMNGDEATRRIRAHARETNAKTPHILALTASLQCDSSTTCDSGDDAEPSAVFDGWLTKPVTMDTIGGALLSFVQHK